MRELTWRPPESPPHVILSEAKDLVRIRHHQNRNPTPGRPPDCLSQVSRREVVEFIKE